MSNPFEILEARLLNIERLLLDIKHPQKTTKNKRHSVKVTAVRNGLSEGTIRNYIKEGKIEAHKIGRRILIDESQFEKGLSEVKSLKYKR
ncbi:helix-turn-helix domain-containing protein [Flavobacterium sp. 245]|uniref:helix-turn-helix domain-containing protein n=1 Tax=Flavobacterium sp. 245 TaxID=2512115 RepID=UPI00105C7EFB|nr:helix-turn-helix domain-containing protein [Flavobacterium sp. 245]TDP02200.1 excisionase family DNA binding protein [Flavobacterium sp. 245]